jgi:hypothetical protein
MIHPFGRFSPDTRLARGLQAGIGVASIRRKRRPIACGTLFGALLVAVAQGGPAQAQRADGTYPVTLACDAGGGSAPVRASGTATIGGGRGTYEIRVGSGRETGSGTLAGGRLTLSGKGPGYEARYAGDVSGRGGFLSGIQTGAGGKSFRRACQFILGDG